MSPTTFPELVLADLDHVLGGMNAPYDLPDPWSGLDTRSSFESGQLDGAPGSIGDSI